jgi:hypothetical protein
MQPEVEGVEAWCGTARGVRGLLSKGTCSGAKFEGTVFGGLTTETVFKGEPM